ncbi:MAG TPA: trypsin-like peptidase domain-containing protein [Actinomycetota bacterium]|nr:trypsin-like peptidase domain-containing protein [Actinomycetota bacterium]
MTDHIDPTDPGEQPAEHVWSYGREQEPPAESARTDEPASTEPTPVPASPYAAETTPLPAWVPPAPAAYEQPRARAPWHMVLITALIAGLLGGVGGAYLVPRKSGVTVERVSTSGTAVKQDLLTGVASVARAVMPSIVRVDVSGSSGPFGQSTSGTGSGVIYTSDGYIITNNHVIDGASSITVTLSTGQQLPATLVGTAAPGDDIAVIKINKSGLTPATLGSTSDLSVGDLAVAIGSPFGLQGTVTAGVISALHRNIDLGQGENLTDAIQTDAPINPGNSGGALADGQGDVIGINTAILGGSGGNVGVGFAIPISVAKRDADQIIKTGKAQRPFLGISGDNAPNSGGALIQSVVSGGPADRAGLRIGDVIIAVNGTQISSFDDLISALSTHQPGQQVQIGYLRAGTHHTATVTLSAFQGT